MQRTPHLIFHAARQMRKATERGDLDAAFKWTFITECQLDMIGRLIAIDESDRRLKRYRRFVVKARNAMLAAIEAKAPAKLAGD